MNIYPQPAPFAIQVELSEGCNLACPFCGINGIREKPGKLYQFMKEETLRSLITQVKELKWNPRIEFAMHGEPTMHPGFVDMVKLVYEIHPKLHIMMTSNGGGLIRGEGTVANISKLFQYGLNVLALDDYDGIKIVGKIRPHLDRICSDLDIKWYEYPKDAEGNPHRRGGDPFISVIADISKQSAGTHSYLNNHCGAAGPLDMNMSGRCAKPFREMAVRWDGSVAICCEDWRGQYKCGNIENGLLEVWHSEAFEGARRRLMLGQRDFGSCAGCTARSYRVGLLPDKYGQHSMDLPDDESNAAIEKAYGGSPLAQVVKRPWESAA
jgi:radical SAM protein with 4Fe4S-binding SPASM domain